MDKQKIIMDLKAVIVYLSVMGAVFPIAPSVSIATLERVIEYIQTGGDDGAKRLAS